MADSLHDAPHSDAPSEPCGKTFEDHCVDLLCKQEQQLARMRESSTVSPSRESLESAKQMLLGFLEFAELHFDHDEFSCAASWLGDVFEHTKAVEVELQQRCQFIIRLFGREGPTGLDAHRSHRQLGISFAQLYWEFFGMCAERFSDDSAREEFLASVISFLKEFGRQW